MENIIKKNNEEVFFYSLYRFFYILLIYLVCVLPTTQIYFLPIICALLFIGFFIHEKINVKVLFILLLLLMLLSLTFMQGLQNNFGLYSKQEFFAFVGAMLLSILGLYVKGNKTVFLKHLFLAIGIYSVIKVSLVVLVILKVLDMFELTQLILDIFGYKIVTYLINGNFNLYRFYLINDLMLLIIPYLYFWFKKNNIKSKSLSFILYLSLLGILFSFSRALIVSYFFLLILSVFSIQSKKKIKSIIIIILLIASSFYMANHFNLLDSFYARFNNSSDMNNFSDGYRNIQKQELIKEIIKHPIMGIGLGGYSLTFPGIENSPYSYENQWYAIFMKFGFLKFSLFFGILISLLLGLCRKNVIALGYLIVLLILPFTNPYLTSVQFSLLLMILIMTNAYMDKNILQAEYKSKK
ncbi:hypothetical protein C1N73_05570 [Priestia aryabhattai]